MNKKQVFILFHHQFQYSIEKFTFNKMGERKKSRSLSHVILKNAQNVKFSFIESDKGFLLTYTPVTKLTFLIYMYIHAFNVIQMSLILA